jgi:hypothetical protein
VSTKTFGNATTHQKQIWPWCSAKNNVPDNRFECFKTTQRLPQEFLILRELSGTFSPFRPVPRGHFSNSPNLPWYSSRPYFSSLLAFPPPCYLIKTLRCALLLAEPTS